MLDIAKDFKPDEIVVLGDFFDAYSVSFHSKNPERDFTTIEHELEISRPELARIQAINPKARLVFLCGNHEDRISRYLKHNAPKLARSMNLESMLDLPRGTVFFPYGQRNRYFMGKLMATHGTLFNQHVAQAMLRKYGCSVIFGHTHRLQEFNAKTVHGERIKGITIGWLGDSHHAGEYIQDLADWCHAFALSYHYPNGEFVIQTIEILKGKAVFDGKIY
jgi:predicted phosphodiesterase